MIKNLKKPHNTRDTYRILSSGCDIKGWKSCTSHKVREKWPKVFVIQDAERSRLFCLHLKGIKIHFSRVLSPRSRAFNTSCRELHWTYHSRLPTPRWDGCEGVLNVRGPLRLIFIYLAWLTGPLLYRGLWEAVLIAVRVRDFSGRWSISKPFPLLFGHGCARSFQLVQTQCGTGIKQDHRR